MVVIEEVDALTTMGGAGRFWWSAGAGGRGHTPLLTVFADLVGVLAARWSCCPWATP